MTEAQYWTPILNIGVGGCVLVWFMLKSEPRMKAIEVAIDRLSRSILLLIATGCGLNEGSKKEITEIMKELDHAETNRKK